MRVVVNADDFGKDENVNAAIRLCFERGYISSTTLMVNMPSALEAAEIAKREGFADRVGLHFNLTQGLPVSQNIRGQKRFCDGGGRFNAAFHLSTLSRLFLSGAESRAVREEAAAQLDRYLALGFRGMHLDSHHHVHTDMAVWRMLEPEAIKRGFVSVRLSRNIFEEGGCSLFNKVYKGIYNGNLSKKGFWTSRYFGSFRDFQAACDSLEDREVAEIMVHPILSEDGQLLDTDEPMEKAVEFLREKGVRLCSYQELAKTE